MGLIDRVKPPKPTKERRFLETQNIGIVSEQKIVKKLGMNGTLASGACEGSKSDGFDKEFRIECKSTLHNSMSLEYAWLRKIKHEALTTTKEPVLSVSFTTGNGEPRPDGEWFIITRDLFEEFRMYLKERDGDL